MHVSILRNTVLYINYPSILSEPCRCHLYCANAFIWPVSVHTAQLQANGVSKQKQLVSWTAFW